MHWRPNRATEQPNVTVVDVAIFFVSGAEIVQWRNKTLLPYIIPSVSGIILRYRDKNDAPFLLSDGAQLSELGSESSSLKKP